MQYVVKHWIMVEGKEKGVIKNVGVFASYWRKI